MDRKRTSTTTSTYKKKPAKKYVKQYRDNLPAVNFAKSPGMNPEMKACDVANATIALDNNPSGSGHTILVNGLVRGTDRYNRIGRRINVKSINVKFFIYTSAASPAVIDDILRFALVWDEQPTGTLPVMSDYWQDVDRNGATNTNMLSHNNLNNTSRFRMLRTLEVPVNAELQAAETNKGRSFVEWNVKMNHICQYNDSNAGTLADFVTGAIYLVGWGNNSASAQWSANASVRVKYLDP